MNCIDHPPVDLDLDQEAELFSKDFVSKLSASSLEESRTRWLRRKRKQQAALECDSSSTSDTSNDLVLSTDELPVFSFQMFEEVPESTLEHLKIVLNICNQLLVDSLPEDSSPLRKKRPSKRRKITKMTFFRTFTNVMIVSRDRENNPLSGDKEEEKQDTNEEDKSDSLEPLHQSELAPIDLSDRTAKLVEMLQTVSSGVLSRKHKHPDSGKGGQALPSKDVLYDTLSDLPVGLDPQLSGQLSEQMMTSFGLYTKGSCFNCFSLDHPFRSCPQPLDCRRIRLLRRMIADDHSSTEKDDLKSMDPIPGRYYRTQQKDKEQQATMVNRFNAGGLSQKLRQALGMIDGENDPPFLARMREAGPPPSLMRALFGGEKDVDQCSRIRFIHQTDDFELEPIPSNAGKIDHHSFRDWN